LLVSEIICRGAGFSYVLTRDTKGMNGLGHQRNEFLTAKSCSGRRYKFAGSTVMTTLQGQAVNARYVINRWLLVLAPRQVSTARFTAPLPHRGG
jgi:hypothetical protein